MAESYNLSEQDELIISLERKQALEIIMNSYGNEIKRVIYTYVKNEADTDDIAQEVFVTVYKKLHTFQKQSSLKSWLYSIAINKSKDYLRSWQGRNRKLLRRIKKERRGKQAKLESIEHKLIKEDESKELIKQIMELPVKYREVIILYYFNDFSTKEISQITKIHDATIRTRLRRARERLKQNIERERG